MLFFSLSGKKKLSLLGGWGICFPHPGRVGNQLSPTLGGWLINFSPP